MTQNKVFVTAINCMDGRTQEPVIDYLRDTYSAAYVDMITEPGPVRILAENRDPLALQSIKTRLDISVNRHHSQTVGIVAHADCAGNPVSDEDQKEQLHHAIKTVQEWYPSLTVEGLWVHESQELTPLEEF